MEKSLADVPTPSTSPQDVEPATCDRWRHDDEERRGACQEAGSEEARARGASPLPCPRASKQLTVVMRLVEMLK